MLEVSGHFVDATSNSRSWRASDDRSTVSSGLAHRRYARYAQGSILGAKRRHTANSASWTVVAAHRRKLAEVASVVGVHYRTVQEWGGWYRQGGVEEVLSHKMGGSGTPRYLSAKQERELVQEVSTGRFRTAGEIRQWIESAYGVSYKLGGVYGLLKRLGCSPKVPRGLHDKADVDAQRAWKKGGSETLLPERG